MLLITKFAKIIVHKNFHIFSFFIKLKTQKVGKDLNTTLEPPLVVTFEKKDKKNTANKSQ